MAPNELAITIQFTTVPKLFEEINAAIGDALIVTDVSQQDYTNIVNERDRRRRRFRFKRYNECQKLIVVIPTEAHELLHLPLYGRISAAVFQMGLGFEWVSTGSTTRRSFLNEDESEGDSSGRPRNPPGRRWPTLVIEAGYSRTLESLRRDVKWWFSASDHQVKIILLVHFDFSSEDIIIEKWQVEQNETEGLEPSRSQLITISRGPDTDAVNSVSGGPLRLDFSLLFLRAAGQGEGDVVLSASELQQLAEMARETEI
ncbi:hypothetical protein BHE90_014799 [Fusarium euwallaceae]|uniref:Uncharacterized protein n=2 Tax=Fusarium solani species complex TaxID=232080 RepID=A0A430L544_9HYPO|nr:hypothetical protein CEP51_015285 [Fusarium floridanum]RTE70800.1 hypothetical protein BHE90_014799 [Fusarium euwallaceae]